MPEFGSWMIEAVPSKPYGAYAKADQLLSCFETMKTRRESLEVLMKDYTIEMQSKGTTDVG
jgi:hypothetical protein